MNLEKINNHSIPTQLQHDCTLTTDMYTEARWLTAHNACVMKMGEVTANFAAAI